ncbi:MAG: CBS domain-containing protein [Syntrophobacteraceae bacterium]
MTRVKDLMTGFSDMVVVDEKANLFEALLQFGVAWTDRSAGARSPVALVVNEENRITGFLECKNLLLAFQPGYLELAQAAGPSGISPAKIGFEIQKSGLLEEALEGLCKKAAEIPIRSVTTMPGQDRITGSEVSISQAAFRMAVSGQDYLFVTGGDVLEGIITLSDLMRHICETVRACRL